MEFLLVLLAIGWTIGIPTIAIVALVRTGGLRQENARLAREIAAIRRDMQGMTAAALPPPFEATTPVAPAELPPPAEAPAPLQTQEPEVGPPLPPAWEPAPPSLPVVAPPPRVGWEERLGARAFIWVGAITIALAAIFLVRYSIEEGYLSPEVRVLLAAVFGGALIAGAETMRWRDERIAQAMTAAGIAALYGSLFSAVALYEMVSRPMAGVAAMALTSMAIGLSLRHGMFVAALAFVGGFASPAFVGGDVPNTPVLFGYLLAIAAGTLAVIRHRGWWILGWGVLAGSAFWTVVWMFARTDGLAWAALFQVAVAGLFVWATWKRMTAEERPLWQVAAIAWTAVAGTGLLLLCLIADDDGKQAAGWLALALHGLGAYALGRLVPRFQYAATLAPALSLAALALAWPGGRHAVLLGGLYAGGAFALMWNAGRPGFWAALSVAAALSHFLLTWWIERDSATATPWGLISIGLAAPFLVGAERLVRWRERMAGATEALGFLAAGVSFFVAAAIPMEFQREWITMAYAVELAAVAVIARWLGLVAMRQLCWPLLAAVVVRFVLNPELLHYPLGVAPLINWMLWGYGIAIAALVVAVPNLRELRRDRLVQAVEAAIPLLAFVLLTLEVRSLFQPSALDKLDSSFIERSVYVVVWGLFALAAHWMALLRGNVVALWVFRIVGGLATFVAVVVQTLLFNPIASPTDLGGLFILNGLLLAYAAPALIAAGARGERSAAVVAVILAFAWASFEVRHTFDPQFKRPGYGADGLELYAYSIVWLLFGVALLAAGFARRRPTLRHAGMILVCLVVAKVFLIDMAGLTGLLRVASFLGLGAALMGLGYAYRRYGFDAPPPAKPEP